METTTKHYCDATRKGVPIVQHSGHGIPRRDAVAIGNAVGLFGHASAQSVAGWNLPARMFVAAPTVHVTVEMSYRFS